MTSVDEAKERVREVGAPAAVPLRSGAHEVWPWAVVRSAGFPFSLWERVHGQGLAALADEVLEAGDGEEAERARARLDEAVSAEWASATARLAAAHEVPALACAVLWQNPSFYRTALRPVLEGRVRKKPSKQRDRMASVLGYLQRYVAKNDSVGFFGPVTWAPLAEDGPPLEVAPGEGLVRRRMVNWEPWAVQELADALLAPTSLRAAVPPRLAPHVSIAEGQLRLPMGQTSALPPLHAAVMERCDGDRTAAEIADDVVADPAGPATRHEDVYEALEALEGRRWLVWRLNTGLSIDAVAQLEAVLDRVRPSAEAEGARNAYSSVAAARAALGGDERDPAVLDQRLAEAAERFAAVTGGDEYRRQGETYAGRTPLCLEAGRDVGVRVGPGFLEEIGPPLDLLMHSARWLTRRVHDDYERRLQAAHRELAPDGGAVDLIDLWMLGSGGWFTEEVPAFLGPLVEEFQSKWAEVLGYTGATGEVRRSADELREPVARAFGDSGPATAGFAQYASPDVMVCWPEGAPAPQRYVLGELHIARNTTVTQCFLCHHPDRAAVERRWDQDYAASGRVTLHGDDRATSNRLRPGLLGARDLEVRVSAQSPHGREGAHRLADFTVAADAHGRLVAASRRDGARVDLMRLVADAVELSCINAFKLVPAGTHQPRVLIDRLVVSRESWVLDIDGALGFARHGDPVRRFLGARQLKAKLGLPQYVFVVYGAGAKPVFVDLGSVVSVDHFCRLVRRSDAETVKVSEMLPRPDELWLVDRDGERYTSELRMAVRSIPTAEAVPR